MAVNWGDVDRLVRAYHLTDPTSSEEALRRQLELWWCIRYNRPFKDPLLLNYSLNDLIFEYLTVFYLSPENDPSEKKRRKDLEDADRQWALQQLQRHQQKKPTKKEPEAPKVVLPEEKPKNNEDSGLPSEPIQIPDLPEISTRFDE